MEASPGKTETERETEESRWAKERETERKRLNFSFLANWLTFLLGAAVGTHYCCLVLSHVQLFVTPWTVAHQAPLSMGFPRQECWSRLPFPSPEIFLTQVSNPHLLQWQMKSLSLSHQRSPKNYSAMRRNEILLFVINLEDIMLSEMSQTGKDKCCMILLKYII